MALSIGNKPKTHNSIEIYVPLILFVKKYFNIRNCQANELTVIPMSTIEKINKDQEKRKKDRQKNSD